MLKNIKKRAAFTIVELVIVIAIIAILSAVLIPTFATLLKAADISSDTQLAKNMNVALATAEATDGKNTTMTEALKDIDLAGYTVERLTPTAQGYHLCWDQEHDRIVFLTPDKEIEYSEGEINRDQLWMVAHDKDSAESSEFNVYLALNEGVTIDTLNVKHGIDVGNSVVNTVNYVNTGDKQDVIIYTNGGTLNVTAPKDTVKHYGDANVVDITAVADASFHEFGSVNKIKIAAGRVVIEETEDTSAKAPVIEITATYAEKPVKIETKVDVVVSVAENAITTNVEFSASADKQVMVDDALTEKV